MSTRPTCIGITGSHKVCTPGEFDGSTSPRLQAFAAACAEAGIDHELSPRIRQAQWEKFVFLVGLSATTKLARLPIGRIRSPEGEFVAGAAGTAGGPVTQRLRQQLVDIQTGKAADPYGWVHSVC